MDKQALIDRLNQVYNTLDNFGDDETVNTAPKAIQKVADEVGDIVNTVESENITEEKENESEG